MALQYSSEQLLNLRNSQLVHKPASLPPAEEWMGPPIDQSTQKRGANNAKVRSEGSFSHGENVNSRPVLETKYPNKGGSNGHSEIVLGPPKTSFTSSSTFKTPGSGFDSPNKSAFGSFGGEARGDYSSRGRFSSDRTENHEDRSRDSKSVATRHGKEESGIWSSRPGRNNGTDEERTFRRNGGREGEQDLGENGKRPHQRGLDSFRRDGGDESQRTGGGRGNRPSWYRDEEGGEIGSRDNNMDSNRTRGWRESERVARGGLDRDWNRGAREEREPEWAFDSKKEEKKERHNAQDIEAWKASMKARDMASTQTDSVEAPVHKNKSKIDTPLAVDPSLDDRFFQSWIGSDHDKMSLKDNHQDDSSKPPVVKSNTKSSKFTGFFGPQTIATPAEPDPAPIPAAVKPNVPFDHGNDDKAGFQRILQMLAGPNPDGSQQSTMPDIPRAQNDTPGKDLRVPDHQARSPPPILSPRSRRAHDLEGLLGLQSPKEGAVPSNKDSEFLLNLLRTRDKEVIQPSDGGLPTGGHRGLGDKSAGMPSQSGLQSGPFQQGSNQEERQQSHFFDEDQAIPNMQSIRAQRQPASFDDGDEGSVFPPQFSMGIPSQGAHPSGAQRPPGLDQMQPPPGFQQQFMQQQRGPSMVAPPPGFGNHHPRNQSGSQFPPGLIPQMNNLNLSNERGPPPFNNIRPVGPGHGPIPGSFPPPGFMGMNGPPPPGFPMLGIPSDAFFGAGRPPMDMFGEPGPFGHGGRGAPPTGQFRRQE